ncbi:alpha carbonic anhydrase 8-like [Hevea brasiliensis]|uniref:alpha carbonic anhydrase 8-like n=1 Tax=Hevea brasiliensis TaxID=3981 RepID=UPI0025EAF959|nr:alpha carbonic anhydrase 8-like [Hevea brasiliensis]
MATPSSPSANPSPNLPSPSQSPLQTPPLPQSPPPSSPPLPQNQTPTLIPPTPLAPQNEAQNETPILETQIQEPMPEPMPTQAKSKAKTKMTAGKPKKAPVEKRKGNPSVCLDFNSSPKPAIAPAAPATSADDIEEVLSPLPWAFKDMNMKNAFESLAFKPISTNKYMDECADRELDMGSMSEIFGFQDLGYKSIEWQQTIYDPVKF